MNNFSTENFSSVDLLRADLSTGKLSVDNAKLLKWVVGANGKMAEYDKRLEEYKVQFDVYETSIANQKSEIKNIKEDLEKQKNRIPEIIGLFSAIIALVLTDVSIIKNANTFLAAILLVISLTCSISIFAIIIHLFFSPEDKVKIKEWHIWTPIVLLFFLVILGIWAYFEKIDLYQMKNENQSSTQLQGNNINSSKGK